MSELIGFVGVGRMGAHMVRRLLEHGHRVVAHDVNPAALAAARDQGATVAESPRAVAEQARLVLTSLPTPPIVEAVVLGPGGLIEGMASGSVYVDLSTTGVEVVRKVAAALAAKGVDTLDAPVSGGVAGASKGTLSVMVAGRADLLEQYRPILEIIGKNVFHVGTEPGQGQAMKLVNNLLAATCLAASCEALVLATKLGLDPKLAIDIINVSTGQSAATLNKIPSSVLPRTFNYGFMTQLMAKDVGLAAAMAKQNGVPLLIGRQVEQIWDLAMVKGLGPEDFTAIIKLFEELAGVEVPKIE